MPAPNVMVRLVCTKRQIVYKCGRFAYQANTPAVSNLTERTVVVYVNTLVAVINAHNVTVHVWGTGFPQRFCSSELWPFDDKQSFPYIDNQEAIVVQDLARRVPMETSVQGHRWVLDGQIPVFARLCELRKLVTASKAFPQTMKEPRES